MYLNIIINTNDVKYISEAAHEIVISIKIKGNQFWYFYWSLIVKASKCLVVQTKDK